MMRPVPVSVQRACACGGRKDGDCEECKRRSPKVQRRERSSAPLGSAWGLPVSRPGDEWERAADESARRALTPERAWTDGQDANPIRSLRHQRADAGVADGAGRPLSPDTREFFETRFGFDFSSVRVHTDPSAAEAAESVDALAYTAGRNIVWGSMAPDPQSAAGRRLLAHELAHVIQQGSESSPRLQRTCLPSAICPIANISLGGSGFNWESAEICLQGQYPFKGIVGSNKNWRFLTAPSGTAEQRDLDCFKSHLVAKSGMFLAQPDIIDFTRAEIYDITTRNQERSHRVRLWADTGEATALAANPDCSGTFREWVPGTWTPSPCYWLGGDLYMTVVNSTGLLLYDVIKDVSKELAAAALLAAIIALGKNQIKKKLATAAAARVPYVAAALAAVTIVVVLTTDAELAFGAEGDPIENLIKAIENSGQKLPDEIKDAMKNDPDLRAKIEAAAKEKNPSERAKKLSKSCLELIAKNKDKFSREDLEALTTMVQMGADDKLPNKAPTVEGLKKQAEKIRKGEAADPEAAAGAEGKGEGKGKTKGEGKGEGKGAEKGKTTADIEKEVQAAQPGLKPETVKKIAAAPELARKLLDRIAGKTGTGKALTDADIERLLKAVPADLTPEQFNKIVAQLEAGTTQEPSELLANLEKHIAAVKKEAQTATAAELAKKHPKLSPASREKLAKASPAARRMLEAVAASSAQGVSLTDDTVDRFLKILGDAVTPEQVEAIVERLADAKPEDTIDTVLTDLEKAVKSKAKAPGAAGGEGKGGGKSGEGAGTAKGKGAGEKGKEKITVPPEARLLAVMLVLLAGKVKPGETRLEWDGKRPVSWSKKTGARFFGKLADGTAFIAKVSVVFTSVKDPAATYKITAATKLYNLNGEELTPDKPLVGRSINMTMDPPEPAKEPAKK